MKIISFLKEFINKNKKKVINKEKDSEIIIPKEFRSHEYEKKLALIIKNTETVDYNDLKNIECTKLDTRENSDLFSAYRLDFHTRDELRSFKKKYKSLLL
tara:strand:- start:472 stop:771 length:300 start_codon:yes stop_codon:yes gene_type:complete